MQVYQECFAGICSTNSTASESEIGTGICVAVSELYKEYQECVAAQGVYQKYEASANEVCYILNRNFQQLVEEIFSMELVATRTNMQQK